VQFVDANAFDVGTASGVNGITSGGTVQLTGTDITQSQAIVAPGGLAVSGGNATIGNAGNVISQYAANNSGTVSITDNAGIVIGTVGAVTGATAADLVLNAGGATVTQTAAIVAPAATINTTGDVTLTNTGNNFGTVNAGTTGALSLADADSIIVNGVQASIVNVSAGGDVTVNSPGSINMGAISGGTVRLNAEKDITDANGKANNITASTEVFLLAKTGTIVTTPTPELAPAYQGINTPRLTAYAGGVTTTTNGANVSIDVWGQVGNDTILLPANPPGGVYLNGRRIGTQPTGVITAALQTWQSSTGEITMMPPQTPADVYSESIHGSGSPRVILENVPAAVTGPDATSIHINNGGIRLPVGLPPMPSAASMQLVPGGAPMNLPNGTVAAMTSAGDVIITLPTAGQAGFGSGSGSGLSAVTITPAGVVTGRDASGMPVALDGGIAGNASLKSLLEQIADFLPEEYRRKWGLRTRSAAAPEGVQISSR
jgi:hypothetical protein